jgi:hypothetical protein
MESLNQESNVRKIQLNLMGVAELKDKIFDIYEKKMIEDDDRQKQRKNRIPMCQFAFSYFVQNCKTNNLRVNALYNLINSVKVNCFDPEVALFALILRNEIEEEFAETFYGIKDKIEILKNKKVVNEDEIQHFIINKEISYTVCLEIVDDMFTESHPHKSIIQEKLLKIKNKVVRKKKLTKSMKNPLKHNRMRRKHPSPAKSKKQITYLSYTDFEKIILNLELKSHFEYLIPLKSEFRKLDPDNYGSISSGKLQDLIDSLFKTQRVKPFAKTFLKNTGRFCIKTLTFSDIVSMFSEKHKKNNFKNVLEIINE